LKKLNKGLILLNRNEEETYHAIKRKCNTK